MAESDRIQPTHKQKADQKWKEAAQLLADQCSAANALSDFFPFSLRTACKRFAVVKLPFINMSASLSRTNLTAKARAGKLSQIPKTYRKIAVFFPTPNEKELQRRLASRPGKNIPSNIVMGMKSQLQAPTTAEGFDEIISA